MSNVKQTNRGFRNFMLGASFCFMSLVPARAQIEYVPIDVMGTAISGAIMDAAGANSKTTVRSVKPIREPKPFNLQSLNFTSTAARTHANVTAFAAKSRKVDPKGAAELERLFAAQDVMAMIEREMAKIGLTKNNVADAYTVWWTNAWLATQGRSDTLPRAQMQAVKHQAALALIATAQVTRFNDAQKQEFAEALLIQAILISEMVEAVKAQGGDLETVKAAVAQGAIATGVDLSAMTLTDAGFRPVNGGKTSR